MLNTTMGSAFDLSYSHFKIKVSQRFKQSTLINIKVSQRFKQSTLINSLRHSTSSIRFCDFIQCIAFSRFGAHIQFTADKFVSFCGLFAICSDVNLSLSWTTVGAEAQLHTYILNLDARSAWSLGSVTPDSLFRAHRLGGWVGVRAATNALPREKLLPAIELGHSASNQSLYRPNCRMKRDSRSSWDETVCVFQNIAPPPH